MFFTYSVNFKIPSGSTFNEYNEEVPVVVDKVVDGCLISPRSSDDLVFPFVNTEENEIRIDIPKSCVDNLSNAIVDFVNTGSIYDGRVFKVIGDSSFLMPENTPGDWNRYIFLREVHGEEV